LSDGDVNQYNDADTRIYRHNLAITLLSRKKKGRRFNINHNLDINNRFNNYESQSDISYYHPNIYDSLYSQLRKERIPRTDVMFMFNYSEPLNKHLTIRLAGRYEYGTLHNGIGTFNSVNGNE
jgi:hypothetical protein